MLAAEGAAFLVNNSTELFALGVAGGSLKKWGDHNLNPTVLLPRLKELLWDRADYSIVKDKLNPGWRGDTIMPARPSTLKVRR